MMAYTVTLGFDTPKGAEEFAEKVAPRIHGKWVDVPDDMAGDGAHRLAVAVSSPTAAREVCHSVVAFLSHGKGSRVDILWRGADGSVQMTSVDAGSPRDAEVLATRIGMAAKAVLDSPGA